MKPKNLMFLKYVCTSILIAAIDYLTFWATQYATENTTLRVFVARFASILVQYILLKTRVFYSRFPTWRTLPLYGLLVVANGLLVSELIGLLTSFGMPQLVSKLATEIALYLPNYWISKKWIFRVNHFEVVQNEPDQSY